VLYALVVGRETNTLQRHNHCHYAVHCYQPLAANNENGHVSI